MAIFVRPALHGIRRTVAAEDAGAVQEASVDRESEKSAKAVYPEARFLVATLVLILLGALFGWRLFEAENGIVFRAPEGIGIFALFYIMAQLIERIQEPLTPFLGTAPGTGDGAGRKNQRQAKGELETAVAGALRSDAEANAAQDAADKKRTLDQIRANLTVIMFGTSALLAMLMAGYLKASLLRTIGVTGLEPWFEVGVTGLVVAAGTKPLHDLISNIKESKEEKQDPPGTK